MRSPARLVPLLVALSLTVAACDGETTEPFGTAEVTVEPVAQVISTPAQVVSRTYAATVRAAARVDVVAPGAATITTLEVTDGTVVAAGDALGRLRSDGLTTALRQAEAARTSALMGLRSAEDLLARGSERPASDPILYTNRIEELEAELFELRKDIAEAREDEDEFALRRGLVEEQQLLAEYDTWVRQVDGVTAARASLQQAEQALQQARRAVADLALVAPVGGTVRIATDALAGGGRQLTVGADVAPGQPVITVTTAEGFLADFAVAEADLAPVADGARVVLDLEAFPGRVVTGTVQRVVRSAASTPAASSVGGVGGAAGAAFVAEVAIDDAGGLPLRDGLTGTATLPALAFADAFEVRLEVDEIDVVLVEVGQQVVVELDALRGQPLTGTIVALAATPERSATGATIYRARVRLAAPDGDVPPLRGGLTGTGDIEVQRLEGPLTVPSTALRRSGGNEVVFVVRGGVAVEVPVRVLAFGEVRAAVQGEIQAGERVVTVGVERIEDGATVEVG
jgi:multidrug efflux pump subunit AcrA (membrane-fusion protein)